MTHLILPCKFRGLLPYMDDGSAGAGAEGWVYLPLSPFSIIPNMIFKQQSPVMQECPGGWTTGFDTPTSCLCLCMFFPPLHPRHKSIRVDSAFNRVFLDHGKIFRDPPYVSALYGHLPGQALPLPPALHSLRCASLALQHKVHIYAPGVSGGLSSFLEDLDL